ncbi:MAG: UbiA family prenyltransferase [Candidatus Rokubacteria bacterium]|nr:UbiA family prenyltransferase [Candidatus Rokubacteria bacterium]
MKWKVYLKLGRVSNLPTVWTNVLAGVVLAGGGLEITTLIPLLVAFSLFYVGGMFLNDAFDRDIDARERPERPIPSGLTSAREVFAIGYGLLAAALLILVGLGGGSRWVPAASGLGLAAAVVYYDRHHKQNPLSPFVMGLCRMLVYVTAALAVTGRVAAPVMAGALALLCYLIGLTYVAKQENLSEYRNLWPLGFLFAPFVYAAPTLLAGPVGALIYAGFLVWVCYAISFLVRGKRVNIPRAVVSFIAGISLLDALLIAGRGANLAAGLCIVGFALTLFLQRYVRGT